MSKKVRTAKELGKAILNNESTIIIEGNIGDITLTLQAVGPVAWAVAIGAIGVALSGVLITIGTGGSGAPAGVIANACAAPVLITSLGSVSTATTAVNIALAGGGVGVLSTLRKYNAKRDNGDVVLTKRW